MKKMLNIIGAAVGGVLVGYFANSLHTMTGVMFFVVGVLLLVFSTSLGYRDGKH